MAGTTYNLGAVYASAWQQAVQSRTDSEFRSTQAIVGLKVPAALQPPQLLQLDKLDDPVKDSVKELTQAGKDIDIKFDTVRDNMVRALKQIFSDFIRDQFPVDSSLASATAWLNRQLTVGGAGINAAVEKAIWDRESDRMRAQTQKSVDDMMTTFTARRFPMPPGAAAHQRSLLEREAIRELAKSSRDQAVETYKAELELTKFAVQQSINYRMQAIQAAGEYLRNLTISATTAQQMLQTGVQARATAVQAATSYFQTQAQVREIESRIDLSGAQLKLDVDKTKFSADLSTSMKRADVAMAAAQTSGTLAAAALNGFGVRFSYGESNDVTGAT